jgi:hypothetical protein
MDITTYIATKFFHTIPPKIIYRNGFAVTPKKPATHPGQRP